jgi:hypothetical protein
VRRVAARWRVEQLEGILVLYQRAAHRLRTQRGPNPLNVCHRFVDDAAERTLVKADTDVTGMDRVRSVAGA